MLDNWTGERGCLILSWRAAEWRRYAHSEDWRGGVGAWEGNLPHLIRTSAILHNSDEIQIFDSGELERLPACLNWVRGQVPQVAWETWWIMCCALSFVKTGKQSGKQNNCKQGENEKCLVKCLIEIDWIFGKGGLISKIFLNRLFKVKNTFAGRNWHCQ